MGGDVLDLWVVGAGCRSWVDKELALVLKGFKLMRVSCQENVDVHLAGCDVE